MRLCARCGEWKKVGGYGVVDCGAAGSWQECDDVDRSLTLRRETSPPPK